MALVVREEFGLENLELVHGLLQYHPHNVILRIDCTYTPISTVQGGG